MEIDLPQELIQKNKDFYDLAVRNTSKLTARKKLLNCELGSSGRL